VFTGFGTWNVQGLLNSFAYDLDNRIHGSASSGGGTIRRVNEKGEPEGPAVAVGGRDFSFDPRTLDFRTETGGAQHGRSTDNVGNVYICHNGDHCIRCMVDDRFLSRNKFFPAPSAKESIALDGPQATVFRMSPVEPWRVLRTRLRAAGIVEGGVEAGGRPAGYLTSGTGMTFVRGDAVGDLVGMLVVGDVGSNIVHRKRLIPHGAGVRAERVDPESELVASTDIWFRPVQFANGPDGALWIIDMQREVIEHPKSLDPPIKKHLDLTSGRDTGRLWRLVAADDAAAAARTRQPLPRLSKATTPELVALLSHANGWHRDTAQRLIVERADPAAAPLLQAVVRRDDAPAVARVHAAHALAGLGSLAAADLVALIPAQDAMVRVAGVRLAERLVADGSADAAAFSTALATALAARAATEPDIHVRLSLATIAGGMADGPRLDILRTLLERDGDDPWCRYAAFTSLRGDAGKIVEAWLADPQRLAGKQAAAALPGLVTQVGRRHDAGELARIVAGIDRLAGPPAAGGRDTRHEATALLGELAGALAATNSSLAKVEPVEATQALVDRLTTFNLAIATDRGASVPERIRGITGLALGSPAALEKLLVPEEPAEIVAAAITTLDRSRDPAAGAVLAGALPRLPAAARQSAAAALVRNADRARLLLDAIAAGAMPSADLERQTAATLWSFPDASIRSLAADVLGPAPPANREPLVVSYRASLPRQGDAVAGKAIFRQQCAACHRVDGEGREIGPALSAVKVRGPEACLLGILDPNREALPGYLAHAAVTGDGRVVTGIVVAQSDGSVTLRTAEGTDTTIPRDDLESFTNTKRSLMPEGFEKTIDARGMADLIAYLMAAP
ncbi:MAG: PVC-type heme-binding CxxCH protein, partial [Planctomycetia bacterium]